MHNRHLCSHCSGLGKCWHCDGSGSRVISVNGLSVHEQCAACHGSGKCQECAGRGYVPEAVEDDPSDVADTADDDPLGGTSGDTRKSGADDTIPDRRDGGHDDDTGDQPDIANAPDERSASTGRPIASP